MAYRISSFALLVAITLTFGASVSAQTPQALPSGRASKDVRLGELKTLNGHFPFQVPDTAGDWHVRAEQLKKRVLVANGLWPMPPKTSLKPVIHGEVKRPGFTVQRVYFQSLPGHYVTGLLFRPDKASKEPRPGVLSPHGHGGRQMQHTPEQIEQQIDIGAEHFTESGSMPKLARCAQLARMGCVTFIFDMLGYADSIQIPREVAHRHSDSRPIEASGLHDDSWVFYSPQADLRLQSIMGLQTWNAIRALDFLASLPDVDKERLAVTGGSGGGTQSILLGAIDNRIKVSFPNGMVSTSMQGGCFCENCNLLRVGTGNVELAALFAPRPQAMTAADDWTRDMMKDGYPELRWLYAMLGNEDDVYCRPMLHFEHNYNYVTRMTMYQWMNKHLELGLEVPVIEGDFKRLTAEETSVWNDEHPAPTNVGPDHERTVCKWLDEATSDAVKEQLAKTKPVDVFNGPLPIIYGVDAIPAVHGFAVQRPEITREATLDDEYSITSMLISNDNGVEIPLVVVSTAKVAQSKTFVVWTLGEGKKAAFDQNGKPTATLARLAKHANVIIPDLYDQGELAAKQLLVDDKRDYSAFTFGYNKTPFAHRVNDLLDVIGFANATEGADVRLLANKGAGPVAAVASIFLSPKQVVRSLINTDGFRFADVASYRDKNFVPGAVKYGDIDALIKLNRTQSRLVDEEREIEGNDLDWLLQPGS